MFTPIRSFAALALLAASVHAGDIRIQVTGTVFSATQTAGPFAGVSVGSTAHLSFEVFYPGTPQPFGGESYSVDVPTLVMQIGAASAVCTGGTPAILVLNDNFAVNDGLRYLSGTLTGGSTVGFDCAAHDNLFGSTDLAQNLGTWSPTNWSTYDWQILNGGNSIDITPVTISISMVATGTPFCFGDGSGTACPCGNASSVGDAAGCISSFGTGGKLRATGMASLSGDTLVLEGAEMPDSTALYYQGTTRQSGGAGSIFGDGLRCAAGSIVRLRLVVNVAGASQFPAAGDTSVSVRGMIGSPGTRTYQVWYRNAAAFCTPSTFNLSNGLEITWTI